MVKLSNEAQVALKAIIDEFQTDERPVRERQIRLWKKLDLMWNGFQNMWWSETAHDWRTFNTDINQAQNLGGDDSFYDRPINVFQAYLQTIIAALSATIPPVECAPDDADNPDDITTAKGGTKIGELIYNHIDAPLVWTKALFVFCLQGMIAIHNRTDAKKEYGEVDVNEYEEVEEELVSKICPNCGKELVGPELKVAEEIGDEESNEFDPKVEQTPIDDINSAAPEEQILCPSCAQLVDPQLQQNQVVVERLVGTTKELKSRQHVEVLGGLYVFVPNYCKNQEDAPLLGYMRETHWVNVIKQYPFLAKEAGGVSVSEMQKISTASGNEEYERWGRLSPQYLGEYPRATPTLSDWWLRPQCYYMISDEKVRDEVEEKFPNGVRVTFVNDIFICAEAEALDDHWSLAKNPLSNYIHYDPLGLLLTSIQSITTDLIDLTLQTVEQGVGQTFADPKVLDFNAYRQMEATPGAVYPAKAASGKSLQDAFFQIKTAQLSSEVAPFGEKVNELGQFVSGALPSLFGGAGPASQRTAGQQQMSRNQAMQRLQTPWKVINTLWKDVFGKVIPAYIKNMLDDERIVRKAHGTFVNDTIKRAQLNGKLGTITVLSSDQLPQSWSQTRDIIMQLLASNNPQVLEALGSPLNLGILQDAIGLADFNLPGEDDREKQYQEIKLLLQAQPIVVPGNPMMQQPEQKLPSIMPELMVDNHVVEGEICRNWLVSEAGQIAKIENEGGYANVVAHLEVHIQMMQQLQSQNAPTGEGPSKAGANPNGGRNFRPEQPATLS